ncbi:MAG: SpoIIE family protein phosphatase [Phycisphaerales bacterium]|nr:SpoIIE family protein phosphatase [Phycisphaerales bacterium]
MSNNHSDHDLDILIDVAQRMSRSFELGPLLETIAEAGRAVLRCDRASIFLYDRDKDELCSTVAIGTGEIRFSARRGIAGESVHRRAVVIVPDAYADPRFNLEIDRQTGYRTRNILSIPLLVPDGEVLGVLQLLNKNAGSFTSEDEKLAAALGALTGIAIKRQMLLDEAAEKQRLERELDLAREIQLGLLPGANPTLKGFDVAGWNRSAGRTGGDYYDFFPLSEDRLAIAVADATGHGIGPALIAVQCRAMLRAITGNGNNLTAVADKINHLLCKDLSCGRFVTTCFGVLDIPDACFHYVSAGHGPLLLYRRQTDEVQTFAATGLPMGVIPDSPINLADPIDFRSGDLFVLLTDGFVEWSRPDGELYGEARLIEVLRRHVRQSCPELIQTIYRDVIRFAEGSPQTDDLTAVLIKRD